MRTRQSVRHVILFSVAIAAFAALSVGCTTSPSPVYAGQRVFESPEAAAAALGAAVQPGIEGEIEPLFGEQARQVLSSGDPTADRRNAEVFAVAMEQGWRLNRTSGSSRELVVGDEQWPFPIPLVRDSRGWWFDTAAGAQEILARRIGRNELAAIAAMQTYVAAQAEYALTGHDGRPAGTFAQRVNSDPGTHNGLYWPATGEHDRSPLAAFAAEAIAQGYGPGRSAGSYFGYTYRALTRQGPEAPGGVREFIVGGDMTGGFAMIAAPIAYGDTGVMSFLVGPDGVVREADLGPDTTRVAASIEEFNPDARWTPVP